MRHAWEQIERGDRLQASEKCWGAVVHALKAVARRRGWRHGSHFHNDVIAFHLATLTSDKQIYLSYTAMEALHANYYNDVKPEEELRLLLEAAEDLLRRIAAADERIGDRPAAPSYERRSRQA